MEQVAESFETASRLAFLDEHQGTVDSRRPSDLGSAACALFVSKVINCVLAGYFTRDSIFDENKIRHVLLESVRAYDNSLELPNSRAGDNGGRDPRRTFEKECAGRLGSLSVVSGLWGPPRAGA